MDASVRPAARSIWMRRRHDLVWRGGAGRPGAGLLARASVTEPPRSASNPPWPEPESYSYVIPFRLVQELDTAIPDTFPGHRQGLRFKVMNSDLQKSLRPLSEESSRLMEECFSRRHDDHDSDLTGIATTGGGWSFDQDLIRRVERAAVAAVRRLLAEEGWREVRDCQQDGCGYDLLYEHPRHGARLVEVKGTAGQEVRFALTALEHQVLSRDPSAPIYVVLNALDEATVTVLDWTDVEELGVRPPAWRVG